MPMFDLELAVVTEPPSAVFDFRRYKHVKTLEKLFLGDSPFHIYAPMSGHGRLSAFLFSSERKTFQIAVLSESMGNATNRRKNIPVLKQTVNQHYKSFQSILDVHFFACC